MAHLAGKSVLDVRSALRAASKQCTPRDRALITRAAAAVDAPSKRDLRQPREENVAGDFYVDHTCIDCDTCRYMAPAFFGRKNRQSAVLVQPKTEEERLEAYAALFSCPTYSIHSKEKDKSLQRAAEERYPRNVPGLADVHHCGFHDEKSFGCASYLVTRPEGNVLVDVPRYVPKLVKAIQAMGGAKYIFLTHRDDVADHDKWTKALGAERIMHAAELNPAQGTDKVEIKLEGDGPWGVPGSDAFEIVKTPGHTEAHCCLVYKPEQVLFSGDHLAHNTVGEWRQALSPDGGALGITRNFNWWRVDEQVRSVQKLAPYDWVHVLPGHGRPGRLADAADRQHQIALLVERETQRGLGELDTDHKGIQIGAGSWD